MNSSMLQDAREFAIKAHGDQKYGQKPYLYHLDMVAENVRSYGMLAQIVAYLHDTIEDTQTTKADIQETFGTLVSECVELLSDEPGENRKARKLLTNLKLAAVTEKHEVVLIVKAADRLSNLSSAILEGRADLVQMYQSEHEALRNAIHRPGLCDDLWHQIDTLIQIEMSDTKKPARKAAI